MTQRKKATRRKTTRSTLRGRHQGRSTQKPSFEEQQAQQTVAKKEKFLVAFRESDSVRFAAKAAGIHRSTHYLWLQNDPEYALNFQDAKADALDALRNVAYERARDGWLEPVYFQGRHIIEWVDDKGRPFDREDPYVQANNIELTPRHAYINKIDNSLTWRYLSTRDKEFIDIRETRLTGSGGGPVQIDVDHERENMERIHADPDLRRMAEEFVRTAILKTEAEREARNGGPET